MTADAKSFQIFINDEPPDGSPSKTRWRHDDTEQGQLSLGKAGEETFGRRNFMELFSVFTSPPLFSILHGPQELGYVDETSFLGKQEGPRILLLGGRAWLVGHVDWQRKVAYVEATELKGRSRWKGQGAGIGFDLCQAIRTVLTDDWDRDLWSSRAKAQIAVTRQEFPWLTNDGTVAVPDQNGKLTWWNFAGSRADATLAREVAQLTEVGCDSDAFSITMESAFSQKDIQRVFDALRQRDVKCMRPAIDDEAIEGPPCG